MKYSFAIAAFLGLVDAKSLYNPSITDVTVYSQMNFEKQVTKKRDAGVSIVHFYKSSGKFTPINSHFLQMENQKK